MRFVLRQSVISGVILNRFVPPKADRSVYVTAILTTKYAGAARPSTDMVDMASRTRGTRCHAAAVSPLWLLSGTSTASPQDARKPATRGIRSPQLQFVLKCSQGIAGRRKSHYFVPRNHFLLACSKANRFRARANFHFHLIRILAAFR